MGFKGVVSSSVSRKIRIPLHLLMEGIVTGLVATCHKSRYCSVNQ